MDNKQPIESIMTTTMENIRDMVDVNTVIGDPVSTPDGSTVIPISRVSFGFVAGGGEYSAGELPETDDPSLPFAGGTGAGVTVHPMGFLFIGQDQVRLLPAQYYAPIDRIIEMVPQVLCDIRRMISDKSQPNPPQPQL